MTLEEMLEKETIKELRIMYSHFFDGKEVDALADLFTEDAVCEFGPEVIHAVTNPWIRLIDDTTANGRWYLHDLFTREGADSPLGLYGIYDDVYKKVDGRWLIHRTRIDFLWPKRQFYGLRDW